MNWVLLFLIAIPAALFVCGAFYVFYRVFIGSGEDRAL